MALAISTLFKHPLRLGARVREVKGYCGFWLELLGANICNAPLALLASLEPGMCGGSRATLTHTR